ncbi:MAG TPA: hypothetical protein PK050_09970, partial [Hyphomonadaceae bacterium]|nr:hypothetical protein [Hyphomonadaceae bacterium]
MKRSYKADGVLLRFALETGRVEMRETIVVVEFRDEAVEAFPERDDIGAGMGVGVVGLEAGDAGALAA